MQSNKAMNKLPEKPITTVIAIKGELDFPDGYCSGSGESGGSSDQPLRRNLDNKPELEGKSVSGALYHHLIKFYPGSKTEIDFLFGQDGNSPSSPLQVEHLTLTSSSAAELSNIRDGVNLRRDLDSAWHQKKFDYETTARNICMTLKMKLELRQGCSYENKLLKLLATILRDLKTGRCRFGGRAGRGLGHCRLQKIEARTINLPEKLTEFLLDPEPATNSNNDFELFPGNKFTPLTPELITTKVTIKCKISAAHPVMIQDGGRTEAPVLKTGSKETEADAWPLELLDSNGKQIPVITGSGSKGMLRARCEKILRTMGKDTCDPGAAENCEKKIRDELEKIKKNETRNNIINNNSCMACRIFGNGLHKGRISCNDAEITGSETKLFFNVALNRMTNGPKNLFNRLPFLKGNFSITLDFADLSSPETTLLLLALRDLAEEKSIPLRFGSGRFNGYGRVSTESIMVSPNDKETPQNLSLILEDADRQKEWHDWLKK